MHNPNQTHIDRERERADKHAALLQMSASARTSRGHVVVAERLLEAIDPHATYVGTPLYATLAQVHATLALVGD